MTGVGPGGMDVFGDARPKIELSDLNELRKHLDGLHGWWQGIVV